MVLEREGDGQKPQNAPKYLKYNKDSDMKSNFERFCIQVKIIHWPFVCLTTHTAAKSISVSTCVQI